MIPCAMPHRPRLRRLSSSTRTNPRPRILPQQVWTTAHNYCYCTLSSRADRNRYWYPEYRYRRPAITEARRPAPLLFYACCPKGSVQSWGARYVSFEFQRIHYRQATYKSVLQISWWMIFWEIFSKSRNVINHLWSRLILTFPSCLVCILDSNKNKTRKRKESHHVGLKITLYKR